MTQPVSRFSTEQLISELMRSQEARQAEAQEMSDAQRLLHLEEENLRLRLLVADLTLRNEALKNMASRKW
jgi:regulator of replication initiation timing